LQELLSLEGRCALVTGAAHGIGAAIARRLAEAGAAVAMADIDAEALRARADDLGATGATVTAVEMDVSDVESVQAGVAAASDAIGVVDVLVNNAGVFPVFPVVGSADADWSRVVATNLDGAFYVSREVATRLLSAGRAGVIVNLASTEAFRAGAPGLSAYVASKHGVAGLTQALALELGPAGIRVLGVAPTICDTPGLHALEPIFAAAGMGDVVERTAASLPLGRMAQPDDVARVVVFCASDLAALMTGSTLAVDAGALTL
jgi:NAD(P)-dependent dehydrogenase (short-subunit alcohol dehydrogenase family)